MVALKHCFGNDNQAIAVVTRFAMTERFPVPRTLYYYNAEMTNSCLDTAVRFASIKHVSKYVFICYLQSMAAYIFERWYDFTTQENVS